VKTCDVCERKVPHLAASHRSKYRLDLCPSCLRRLRQHGRTQHRTWAQFVAAAQAAGPPYSWPLCELCGGSVDEFGLGFYTTKGTPRRFCSIDCRQTRNSRVGAPIRAEKARERVRRGEWQNPAESLTAEEVHEYARRGAAVRAQQHRQALAEGTWQNPADAPGAREKLSQPRRHGDNPVLHRAIERLTQGASVADLTEAEAEAHRAWRRELRATDPERSRRYARESYRRRMATEEGRTRARTQWEQERERLCQRPPNDRLRQALESAGLSRAALAELVGVSQGAVSKWVRHGAIPRSAEVRRRVVELLGEVWD